MIHTRHLMTLTLEVPSSVDLGKTPRGQRKIAQISGGHFEGERLQGQVLSAPGGDWLLLRDDGVLCLDVRITLKTQDQQMIFMSYQGLRHGPQEVMERLNRGEPVPSDAYYFRMAPVFETASETYAWLNRALFVATGHREPTGPVYQIFEVL
jgi:Protein of unknown function (DUF3237)